MDQLHLPESLSQCVRRCLFGWGEVNPAHSAERPPGTCLPSCTPVQGQQGLPAAPAAAWLNLVNLLCELLIITEAFQN
jgi:hypothetical protein